MTDRFYFLSVAMKKPRMHVLIKGFPDAAGMSSDDPGVNVSIFKPPFSSSSKEVVFQTSYQVFQELIDLSASGASSSNLQMPRAFDFRTHTYSVDAFQPLHTVSVRSTSDIHQFQIGKPASSARQTRLPFGLTISKRKAAFSPKPKAKSSKKPKAAAHRSNVMDAQLHDQSGPGPDLPSSQSSSDSDHLFSSSSSDSSETEDLEEVMAQTIEALAEEKEQVSLAMQHMQQAAPAPAQPAQPAQPAGPAGPAVRAPRPLGQGSFCNSRVGLIEIGQQTAHKLAKCRECGNSIPRFTARFGYAFHLQKFHAWLHTDCVVPYMKKQHTASWKDSLDFLQAAKRRGGLEPLVLASVNDLEAKLLVESRCQ